MGFALVLALASAFADALNAVTQHVASTAAPRAKGLRLALYLIRSPLWLFGIGAMVASFVLQSWALYEGQLSTVQAVLMTSVVFILLIGRLWLHRPVSSAAWLAAAVTSAGLILFLVMAEPSGGHAKTTPGAWLSALLVFGCAAGVFTFSGWTGSPTRKAAAYGAASGVLGALFATFLKSVAETVGVHGPAVALQNAEIWGLIATGVTGIVLTQAALHSGPLALSQPIMVSVNPFASIILSVWIFGEHFTGGPAKVAAAALGFAITVVGIVLLGRTAPSLAYRA